MKKTLLIAVAAFALIFTACNKADVQDVVKGMTLSASVDATKATIAPSESGPKWEFSWETGDQVKVTAPSGKFTFTKPASGDFYSADAVPASGTWTAYYPTTYGGGDLDASFFQNQDGTLESAMKKYCMTGTCTSDGSPKLQIKMNPKVAILEFTSTDYFGGWAILFKSESLGNNKIQLLSQTGRYGLYYLVIPECTAKDAALYLGYDDEPVVSGKSITAGSVITFEGKPKSW